MLKCKTFSQVQAKEVLMQILSLKLSIITIILILTYIEIGFAIGLSELGCAPNASTASSRRNPFGHVFLQCFLWPLTFIIIRSASWFEKIVKLTIVAFAIAFLHKYSLPFLIAHIEEWALAPSFIGGILVALALFGFLRMPGFKASF